MAVNEKHKKEMKINIEGGETIAEVKEHFQKVYPMLKLEFFKHEHKADEGSPLSDKISDEHKLDEVRTSHTEGSLEFDPQTIISDLESKFHDQLGLNVQVFRKSGELWLEIISTDNRSLREENEWAEEMARPAED